MKDLPGGTFMPFYDLHCADCGADANIRASVAEKTEKRIACPQCGSTHMETIYKPVHFHVKSTEAACPNSHRCGGGCPHAH
jgi:putative FmdB family regulatory protein